VSRCGLALPVVLSAASLSLLLAPPVASAARRASAAPAPISFTRTVITLGVFRGLTVRGCLDETRPGQPARPVSQPVTLEYRTRPGAAWRRLRVIRPTAGSNYCATGSPAWSAMVTAPVTAAWYRLSFAGTAALSAAASRPVRLWRSPTRVTAYRVTPRRAADGAAITVSGRLWRHAAAGWVPDPRRHVVVLFRYRGDWYYFLSRPLTNALGDFSGRFTVHVTAVWVAQYDGDHTHFGSASAPVGVKVTGG
jgi:hypothetical protein